MLQDQKASLSRFGVEFDVWFSERQLVDSRGLMGYDTLQERGMVYRQRALSAHTNSAMRRQVLVKSDGNYISCRRYSLSQE